MEVSNACSTYWTRTMATASLSTLSPNTRAYRSMSTFKSLKMANTVTARSKHQCHQHYTVCVCVFLSKIFNDNSKKRQEQQKYLTIISFKFYIKTVTNIQLCISLLNTLSVLLFILKYLIFQCIIVFIDFITQC